MELKFWLQRNAKFNCCTKYNRFTKQANVLLNKEMIPFYGDNYSPVNFNLSSLRI